LGLPARMFSEDGSLVTAPAREFDADETAAAPRRELPEFEYTAILVFFSPSLDGASNTSASACAIPTALCSASRKWGRSSTTRNRVRARGP